MNKLYLNPSYWGRIGSLDNYPFLDTTRDRHLPSFSFTRNHIWNLQLEKNMKQYYPAGLVSMTSTWPLANFSDITISFTLRYCHSHHAADAMTIPEETNKKEKSGKWRSQPGRGENTGYHQFQPLREIKTPCQDFLWRLNLWVHSHFIPECVLSLQ